MTTATLQPIQTNTLDTTERTIIGILCVYFGLLCFSAMHLLPPLAIYYYWDWGRHLALSYFDNPPMIAYMLRAITTLFGNNIYVINLFAVITAYGIGLFVFNTTKLLAGRKAGLIAMLLWLISPMVTQYIINYNTYDTPLNLFWAMTLFFAVRFMQNKRNSDLYWLGLGMGLMLLTKYTGIILVLGLLICALSLKDLRNSFANKHFYFMIVLALTVFSPVLVWNYQHDWISFTYQLHTHATDASKASRPFHNSVMMLLHSQLPMFNILFGIMIYGFYKTRPLKRQPTAIKALLIITCTFSLFYLLTALKAHVLTSWILPGILGLSILTGYFWSKLQFSKTLCVLLPIYAALSAVILLANTVYAKRMTKAGGTVTLMQAFNEAYPNIKEPIFTTDYLQARVVYFIKNQPEINTFPGCFQENQYQYWSQNTVAAVHNGKIKQALYVVDEPKTACAKQLFQHVKLNRVLTVNQKPPFAHKFKQRHLYVYQLSNT